MQKPNVEFHINSEKELLRYKKIATLRKMVKK